MKNIKKLIYTCNKCRYEFTVLENSPRPTMCRIKGCGGDIMMTGWVLDIRTEEDVKSKF